MKTSLISRIPPVVLMPVVAALVAASGFWLLIHGNSTALVACMALCLLLAVYYQSRQRGIYLALIFLVFLGDIRRIWSSLNGFATLDILVLVGPAFVILIATPIFLRLRLHDIQSKLALGVMLMMVLEVFNPGQGALAIGASGLLITLPPLLWFWIGRTYGTEKMMRVVAYKIIVPAALIACVVGLYQTFGGVPFWQQDWVNYEKTHSTVLKIGSGIRAFGFSNASSEYMSLILLACYFCVIGAMAGRRIFLLFLPVLIPTLFLASSRGRILDLIVATALGYTFKSRNPATFPIRLVFALIVGFGGLAFALSQHGDEDASTSHSSAASAEISHQVNGLAHPFDKRFSTGSLHQEEILSGLIVAFKHPIGYGTGTSYGGGKAFTTESEVAGSEFEITDAFINLGLPGGLLYVAFVISVILAGFRYIRTGPRDLSLPIFAMMIPQIGSWLFPREYGNGAIFLFLLGSMVRLSIDSKNVKSQSGEERSFPYPKNPHRSVRL